jgi:hypothetical protein
MACTSTKLILGCKIPHELDALIWKATGRRRRRRRRRRVQRAILKNVKEIKKYHVSKNSTNKIAAQTDQKTELSKILLLSSTLRNTVRNAFELFVAVPLD